MISRKFNIVLIVLLFSCISLSAWNFEEGGSSQVSISTTTYSGNLTNLSQMNDTTITYPVTDNYVLSYDDATGKWIATSPSAVGDTNCSVDGSCDLITYDSELNYYTDSDIDGSESAFDGWDKDVTNDFTDISNFTGTLTDTKYCTYDSSQGMINCTSEGGGITWSEAINGTLLSQATFDTNYTDLNSTGLIINWSGDYITLATLLGFDYYNSTDFSIADYLTTADWNTNYTANNDLWLADTDTFVTNYSNFSIIYGYALNSTGITWAEAMNNTLMLQTTWNTNYTENNDKWLNTTNSTYHVYNSTGLIRDWNSTSLIQNWSLASIVETDPLWTTNYSLYNDTWSSITNTSYYLVTNPFDYYNSTDFSIADYLTTADWNTNYTANNDLWLADTDTFVANYSTFLSMPTWEASMNGTLYLASNPYGFYNSTNPQTETDPYWTANQSNYFNQTDILGFSYWNDTSYGGIGNWSSDKGDYYTSAQTDTAIETANTSVVDWVTAQEYTADGVSLATLLGFSYYNSTDFSIADYLTTADWNTNYTANNDLWLADTDDQTCAEVSGCIENAVTNATMNKTISCTDIIGSPDADFCTDAEGTGITWAEAMNDTLMSQETFDTNYTANNDLWLADTDTFVANYSTFLTHLTLTTLLGFDYYNSTDFSIADYSTTSQMNTAIENANTSVVNWVGAQNYLTSYTETDPQWEDNFTKYNTTWGTDTNTQLTEDNVEAYIFDTDNTANLPMEGYNVTNVSYSTFCNGANCWKMYVNSSDYFIIEEI